MALYANYLLKIHITDLPPPFYHQFPKNNRSINYIDCHAHLYGLPMAQTWFFNYMSSVTVNPHGRRCSKIECRPPCTGDSHGTQRVKYFIQVNTKRFVDLLVFHLLFLHKFRLYYCYNMYFINFGYTLCKYRYICLKAKVDFNVALNWNGKTESQGEKHQRSKHKQIHQ